MKIQRGDILYADLGVQYQGSMQGGMRPVVVVSNNKANKHSTVITVVRCLLRFIRNRACPLMYSYRHIRRRGWNSTALCEQVMALNFDRIIEHMGKVDEKTLGRITEGV